MQQAFSVSDNFDIDIEDIPSILRVVADDIDSDFTNCEQTLKQRSQPEERHPQLRARDRLGGVGICRRTSKICHVAGNRQTSRHSTNGWSAAADEGEGDKLVSLSDGLRQTREAMNSYIKIHCGGPNWRTTTHWKPAVFCAMTARN
jgi:hypothetical protein